MNKRELALRLQEEGFRSGGYDLDGGTPCYDGLVLRRLRSDSVIE